jgi:hypothetical protein
MKRAWTLTHFGFQKIKSQRSKAINNKIVLMYFQICGQSLKIKITLRRKILYQITTILMIFSKKQVLKHKNLRKILKIMQYSKIYLTFDEIT